MSSPIVDLSKDAPPDAVTTEICVIGSGCGGGTAARLLAEAGHEVLILEEGRDLIGAERTQRDGAMYDQLYMDRGGRASHDLSISVLQGRVLGVGGGGLLALRGRAPSVEGLQMLDDHEYRTLKSLVEVMLPKTDAIPVDSASMDLPREFDDFLANEPEHAVRDLRKALVLVEFGPLVFDKRVTTFSRLDVAERSKHWEAWAVSDNLLRRQVSVAMRKFFNLVYFDNEEVWPHIGYPGPSLKRKGKTP